jgi:2-oxoglutarate ferredoxin oxidoreductase subunit beta
VEVISQCPVQFGKVAKLGKAVDMLDHFRANSIRLAEAEDLNPDALKEKIVVGEFQDEEKEELASQWANLKREITEGGAL